MNNHYREVSLPTAAARLTDTVSVSGETELDRQYVRSMLSDGSVEILEATAANEGIMCKGRLLFGCVCEDENKELHGLSASADFEQKVECKDVQEGMTIYVTAQIIEIKTDISGEKLSVNAEIELLYRAEQLTKAEMLTESDGVEVKSTEISYFERECVSKSSSFVREEIVAANIGSVVCAKATAVIRDITAVVDTARIDGMMSLCALCRTNENELVQLRQNIPFTVEAETKYDNCKGLTGNVSVSDVRMRLTGDDYGMAIVDAQIHTELFAVTQIPLRITLDAFSPKEPFNCITTDEQLLLYKETAEQKSAARSLFHLDNMQEYSEAVFCIARPRVTSATKTEKTVISDGILHTTLLYKTKAGELKEASDDMPFSTEIPVSYANIEIDCLPVCTFIDIAKPADKGIEMNISLSSSASIYELRDVKIVTGTKECEKEKLPSGFLVCFASEGDTPYDIAKRFGISTADLLAANTDMGEVLKDGTKAILMR